MVHFNPGTGLWMVAVSGVLGIVFAAFVLLRKPKAGAFTEVPGRQWLQPVPPPPPVRPTVADTPPAGSAE